MEKTQYDRLRQLVGLFVGAIVAVALVQRTLMLAAVAGLTGVVFLALVRSRVKHLLDEREQAIQEKAAHLTYTIFAPTLGVVTFMLLFPTYSGLEVFAKGEFVYLESLGMVFAYLVLLLIAIYALAHHFLNRKYGGDK